MAYYYKTKSREEKMELYEELGNLGASLEREDRFDMEKYPCVVFQFGSTCDVGSLMEEYIGSYGVEVTKEELITIVKLSLT